MVTLKLHLAPGNVFTQKFRFGIEPEENDDSDDCGSYLKGVGRVPSTEWSKHIMGADNGGWLRTTFQQQEKIYGYVIKGKKVG